MFEISVVTKERGENIHFRETWQGVLNLFGNRNLSGKLIRIVERPSGHITVKDYGFSKFKRGDFLIKEGEDAI